ncbi:ABC transporter substrate-binding protein (plasmid) [Pseudoalteromonas sp. T1lg65]|uniref:ABC transporter substrate-binding protein n=1 Tax=Pseudoalteromonas sp. T1lg65 TaxID=2077101 RepID=UPI003F79F2B8
MLHKLFIFIVLIFSYQAVATEPSRLKVTFINPGYQSDNPTGDFWRNVSKIMQGTAKSLNIDLRIIYADRNHIKMKSVIKQQLSVKQDYLIVVDEKSVITNMLISTSEIHTKIVFLFNGPDSNTLSKLQKQGLPVIGTIKPDNHYAGLKLLNSLFKVRHKNSTNSPQSPAQILVLLGDVATEAALMRQSGMQQALQQNGNAEVVAAVNCYWSEKEAYRVTKAWLQRSPSIDIIWAANDPIAYGALRAAKELSLDDKVVIGGINWDKDIATQLDVSIGGHVLLGNYALTLISSLDTEKTVGERVLPLFEELTPEYFPLYDAVHGNFFEQPDPNRYTPSITHFSVKSLNKQISRKNKQE